METHLVTECDMCTSGFYWLDGLLPNQEVTSPSQKAPSSKKAKGLKRRLNCLLAELWRGRKRRGRRGGEGGGAEGGKQATKGRDEKWSGEMKASVCCRQLLSDHRPPLDCLYCQTLFDFSTAAAPPTVLLSRLATQTLRCSVFFPTAGKTERLCSLSASST